LDAPVIMMRRFHASVYQVPDLAAERKEMLDGIKARLSDLHLVSAFFGPFKQDGVDLIS